MHTIRVAGVALLTVAGLALAGCAGDGSASKDTSASVSGTSRCTVDDLKVRLSPGEGAAGSTFFLVRLTNTTGLTCRSGGFGGVSLVGGGDGRQIGAPADRVEKPKLRVVTLKPGASAEAKLQLTEAANYPATKCRPVQAQGFRVYPPNQTKSAFVRHPATACRNNAVHLLRLSPYQPAG
ncbi:MAG: DUF4232 domain-containing protein [Nocardioidaceae bacterium]